MDRSKTGNSRIAPGTRADRWPHRPSLGLLLALGAVVQTLIFQVIIVLADASLFPYFQYAAMTVTYVILTGLILMEIQSLDDFHVDRPGLALFVLSTILRRRLGINGEGFFLTIIAACGAVTVLMIALRRPRLARVSLAWAGIGIAVGCLLYVPLRAEEWLTGILNLRLLATGLQAVEPHFGVNSLAVAREAIYQLSFAVPTEELLFRGFLWGYLERRGWTASGAGWGQGILFWLIHWPKIVFPLSLLVSISIATFAVSAMTLRSKRILPAMLAHGIVNTLIAVS